MNNRTKFAKSFSYDYSLVPYFREIGKIKILKKEEEHLLGKKIQQGDHKSLNELVLRNLRYVVKVANTYKGYGLALSDLINEGNIGLIQAARRFDPFRDIRFITYANWWIHQAIRHSLAKLSGIVRLPSKQAAILSKIKSFYRTSLQNQEKIPTTDELAVQLGVSSQEIESILMAYRYNLSLNTPLKGDATTDYIDILVSKNETSLESQALANSLKESMSKLLKGLSTLEEKILRYRFGFCLRGPSTLAGIGREMNLSRERVRQIEKKAKEKLRSRTKSKTLQDFLN